MPSRSERQRAGCRNGSSRRRAAHRPRARRQRRRQLVRLVEPPCLGSSAPRATVAARSSCRRALRFAAWDADPDRYAASERPPAQQVTASAKARRAGTARGPSELLPGVTPPASGPAAVPLGLGPAHPSARAEHPTRTGASPARRRPRRRWPVTPRLGPSSRPRDREGHGALEHHAHLLVPRDCALERSLSDRYSTSVNVTRFAVDGTPRTPSQIRCGGPTRVPGRSSARA
jgi:hypothetical protein